MKRVNTSKPYGRTTWSGQVVDNRTASALRWVQKKSGVPITVVQGSYKKYAAGGGASASAGTHDLGGVVDVQTIHLTRKQRIRLMRWAKRAGFAAFYRNWPGNVHAHWVLRGHRNLDPSAAAQVVSFDNHRDGLAYNKYDPTWRPKKRRRWSHKRNRPILGK